VSLKPEFAQIIKVDLIVYNSTFHPKSPLILHLLQSELRYLAFQKIRIGDEGATYRWSSMPGCPSDCVVPAGETWILDANMDVRKAEKQSHLYNSSTIKPNISHTNTTEVLYPRSHQ
jgi:hypothetical protein